MSADALKIFSVEDDKSKRVNKRQKVDFSSKSKDYQRKIRATIGREVMDIFMKHNVSVVDDMMEIWNVVAKDFIGYDVESSSFEDAFAAQEKEYSLQERYTLYRLLTHSPPKAADESASLNEDILKYLPFLRRKSQHILEVDAKGRQERCDKIDLEFIDDYMHDYCR